MTPARSLAFPTVGLLLILLPACGGPGASSDDVRDAPDGEVLPAPVAARIDSVMAGFVASNEVVGLQVAVGRGSDVVWAGAYGSADLESERPVTNRSKFRTASISKWMTATAAMSLVEDGLLDLDREVQEYCPEYPRKQWPLTTRELLYHRGGVRHYWGANGEPTDSPRQRQELEERIRRARLGQTVRYTNTVDALAPFRDDPLLFEPGTDFRYTSFGYRVVGCVLRGAADDSYNEVMQRRIFDRAGMAETRDDDAWAIVAERVRGYRRAEDGSLLRSRFRDVSENLPAGGHLSTASDLVRFALAWNGGTLVSESSKDEMTMRPVPAPEDEPYRGLGLVVADVEELGGRRVYLHSGSQDETRTWLVLRPDAGVALAILSNDEDVPLMTEVIWPALNMVEGRAP